MPTETEDLMQRLKTNTYAKTLQGRQSNYENLGYKNNIELTNTTGKKDKYNKADSKWTDRKQSWQVFPKYFLSVKVMHVILYRSRRAKTTADVL